MVGRLMLANTVKVNEFRRCYHSNYCKEAFFDCEARQRLVDSCPSHSGMRAEQQLTKLASELFNWSKKKG
jgi:hypothetical protein